jgi:hypothetical protein
MTNEIEKREQAGLPAIQGGENRFDGDVADILIPKLLIGQGTSKLVQTDKITQGQIWRSTTEKAEGGKGTKLEIIPLSQSKVWVVSEKPAGAQRFKFSHVDPFVPGNNLPWNWTEKGENGKPSEWKREQSLNFYVLLPSDIRRYLDAKKAFAETGKLPSTSAALLPVVLQFKSTSYKEGRKLTTHFVNAADFDVPPYVQTFLLDTERVSNDTNAWYVYSIEEGPSTDPAFIELCEKWRKTVKGSRIKVDDSDLAGEGGGSAPPRDDIPPPTHF